jgi:hypothetical protein
VSEGNKRNTVVDKRHKENKTTQTKQQSTERAMGKSNEKKVVGIRLMDLMREALASKADQNGRSLSGEIVYRLRKSLEEELANEQSQRA